MNCYSTTSKEKLRRKVKLYEWDQKQNVNTNDDGDDNATPHFTACVALHNMHTHKYIHWVRTCTQCLICLEHFIHTHIGSSSSLVRTSLTTIIMAIHVSDVSSPWSPLSTSLSCCRPCSFTFSSSSPTRSSWQTCTTPQRRVWTLLTSSPSSQVMSPRPMTSTSFWTRRRLSPSWPLLRTRITLEEMLYRVHRAQVDHSAREDLSVSLSSSSMSDRTGQPVGDRLGQPGEHESSEAQTRTPLDEQKQIVLAECHARVSHHELQTAQAEEERRLLQGQIMATEIGISWSSSTKSYWDGRITEISEFCTRYYSKTKIHRGSEHYLGIMRQSTGIAKWSKLYERF